MSETDEIKARLDIVDVVSETVTLKKSGRNYLGFCPFHSNTKTPSFVVFPETQTWRCFGACADGGDLFSFVMRREGFGFKEALETLARQAGVQLQSSTPRSEEQNEQRQKLLEINAAAAEYFHRLLTGSNAGAHTRAYLAERELAGETIATFQLGYALDEWEVLKKEFIGRGYTAEDLLAAGLVVERDDHTPGYDRFRNRLIIPIRDTRGRVVGFGARALAPDQVPKYLNSPQSLLFDKSATLYGLDLARKFIRQADEAIIVEGYMDVIQAHQQGARNVVAQMGTALTEQQLKQVASLANKIVLALDADTAGNAATVRSLSVARQTLPKKYRATSTSRGIEIEGHIGQEIYIAALPEDKDPDDILREGLEVWEGLIARAIPSLDFYEGLILNGADLATPEGKSFVVRELMPVYREIKDSVEKVARVQRLARRTGLDERLLMVELKTRQPNKRPSSRGKASQPAPIEDYPEETGLEEMEPLPVAQEMAGPGLEAYCLSLILANPAALAMANEILEQQGVTFISPRDFRGSENRAIFEALQVWTALETPKIDSLVEMVDDLLEGRLATLASQWHRRPPAPVEDVHQDLSIAVLRLRLQTVNDQISELRHLLQETEEIQDAENALQYRQTINDYSRQRRKLHDTRDALSLMGKRRAETDQYRQVV